MKHTKRKKITDYKDVKNIDDMNEYFEAKGTKIFLIDDDGSEVDCERIPSYRDIVNWRCFTCKEIQPTPFSYVLQKKTKKANCASCAGGRRPSNYECFVKDLEKEGWTMKSSKAEYENTKSEMTVTCNTKGHKEMKTSYNRWRAGHRCVNCSAAKYTIDDVKKKFEEKGRTLLEDVYINNHTPMRCICPRCEEPTWTSLDNLDTTRGCSNCARVRFILEGVICKFNMEFCHLIFVGKTYDDIKHLIEEEEEGEIVEIEKVATEVIFHSWPNIVRNSDYVVYTCSCGNSPCCTTWKAFNGGVRCMDCTKEKMKNTCIQRYGFDNPFNSPEVQEKIIMDRLRKCGVKYPMQLEENVKKAIETNKKNHGGVHNLRLPEQVKASNEAFKEVYGAEFGRVKKHREMIKETNMKKLGVPTPFESKKIQDKIKESNMKEYGNPNYIQSDAGKKQMIELYGVPNAMQNPEIFSKAMKSAFSSKPYEYPSGNVVYIQGYEHYALNDLLESGIEENDIVIGNGVVECVNYEYGGKKRVYFPDIYIKSLDLLIEVKSTYTYEKDKEKNDRKFEAACKNHNFELRIYGPKGNLIEKRRYDY